MLSRLINNFTETPGELALMCLSDHDAAIYAHNHFHDGISRGVSPVNRERLDKLGQETVVPLSKDYALGRFRSRSSTKQSVDYPASHHTVLAPPRRNAQKQNSR